MQRFRWRGRFIIVGTIEVVSDITGNSKDLNVDLRTQIFIIGYFEYYNDSKELTA